MATTRHTTTEAAHVHQPHIQKTFDRVRRLVAVYGALGAVVLVVDVILSVAGEELTSFLWGRTGGVLASAVVTYWLTGLAARGSRTAFLRVRVISVVTPIAVIAVDLIPDALPPWFVATQIAGALVLTPTAFLVNAAGPRAAFRARRQP